MRLRVRSFTCVYFLGKLFFPPVMNPDGENLFLHPYPPTSHVTSLPLPSLWLWQWGEAVLFIGSVVYGGNDLLSLGRLEAASSSSPPFSSPCSPFYVSLQVYCQVLNLLSLSVSVWGTTVKRMQHNQSCNAFKNWSWWCTCGLKSLLEIILELHRMSCWFRDDIDLDLIIRLDWWANGWVTLRQKWITAVLNNGKQTYISPCKCYVLFVL